MNGVLCDGRVRSRIVRLRLRAAPTPRERRAPGERRRRSSAPGLDFVSDVEKDSSELPAMATAAAAMPGSPLRPSAAAAADVTASRPPSAVLLPLELLRVGPGALGLVKRADGRAGRRGRARREGVDGFCELFALVVVVVVGLGCEQKTGRKKWQRFRGSAARARPLSRPNGEKNEAKSSLCLSPCGSPARSR